MPKSIAIPLVIVIASILLFVFLFRRSRASKDTDGGQECKKHDIKSENLAMGIALGVAIGTAIDNVGAGIALGIAFGYAFEAENKKKKQ